MKYDPQLDAFKTYFDLQKQSGLNVRMGMYGLADRAFDEGRKQGLEEAAAAFESFAASEEKNAERYSLRHLGSLRLRWIWRRAREKCLIQYATHLGAAGFCRGLIKQGRKRES